MENPIEFTILMKIKEIKYLEDIQNGKLYMNNLKYFVDLEKNTGIQGVGDICEASQMIIKRHELFVQVEGEERQEIPLPPAPGIIYDTVALLHPVFCITYKNIELSKANETQYIGNLQLTEYETSDFTNGNDVGALVITDVGTFLERVHQAALAKGIQGKHGAVTYRNKRIPQIVDGGILLDTTFTKDLRFSQQSEFRIELFKESAIPFILEIGDIHDISFIIQPNRLHDKLSFMCNTYI